MKLDEMNLTQVEERLAALELEVRDMTEVADVEKATEEKRALLERKAELADIEKRKMDAKALETGAAAPEKIIETEKKAEERKMFDATTMEYRSAFYASLRGNATPEQEKIIAEARSISVDNSAPGNGDAIAIPKTLDEKIWDNIHSEHPILADIETVRSGTAMEVTRHTAIAARTQKKLDKAANAGEEVNTFVKVVLYGSDYEKYVELTYAEAKMSDGALEDYLALEISAELGEALAKDVFAQIESDAGVGQQVTASGDLFQDVKDALAKAKLGGRKVIYAPSTEYYNIVGAVKSGSPFNIAATLGCEVKLDDAAAHVTVLAPRMFVMNEAQDIMIESDRDIKNHKIIVSGYMRAQGTMRNVLAAAFIA